MSLLSRRAFLRGSTPVLSTSLGGCLGSSLFGCDSRDAAVIRTKQVTLSETERDSIDPMVFNELPDAEQKIVRTAIEEGSYRKCPAADPYIPEPLTSFAQRTAAHTGEDGHDPADLKYDGTYYAIGVSIEDGSYSNLPD